MLADVTLVVGITTLCMLSPGPDMVLVMHSTLMGDRQRGMLTSAGILTGNLVHITYCAVGVGYVVAHSVVAYGVLKAAGATYLIFLGASGLRAAVRPPDAPEALSPPTGRDRAAYVRGLTNNLLNPKGALFYLGVFTQVITPATPIHTELVLVAAMIATSALFWVAFVYTLHLPVIRRTLGRFRRSVEAMFGAVLLMLGLRIALEE